MLPSWLDLKSSRYYCAVYSSPANYTVTVNACVFDHREGVRCMALVIGSVGRTTRHQVYVRHFLFVVLFCSAETSRRHESTVTEEHPIP